MHYNLNGQFIEEVGDRIGDADLGRDSRRLSYLCPTLAGRLVILDQVEYHHRRIGKQSRPG